MGEMFEAKVRRLGNSLGIIIPNEVLRELGFGDGDMIRVAIPCSDMASRNRKLMSFIGTERGGKRFRRDRGDRY